MNKGEKVWLVVGAAESGDRYVAVFKESPRNSELRELVHSWDSQRDGPGYDGSYVHITVTSREVQ